MPRLSYPIFLTVWGQNNYAFVDTSKESNWQTRLKRSVKKYL